MPMEKDVESDRKLIPELSFKSLPVLALEFEKEVSKSPQEWDAVAFSSFEGFRL